MIQTALKPIDRMLTTCPDAKGPHGDNWYTNPDNPKFDFRENEDGSVFIHPWTGHSIQDVLSMIGLTDTDLYRNKRQSAHTHTTLDVISLAHAKCIPWQFLYNLGLTDSYSYHGRNYVGIPYHLPDGTEHTKMKVRKAISGDYKHSWDEDTPGEVIPYGLHKLRLADEMGYLLLGEGESDGWACWLHGVPYLGLPGANQAKKLTKMGVDLSRVQRIYILHEPDQVKKLQKSGKGFYKDVHRTLRKDLKFTGEIFCVEFEKLTGCKDPSDLHMKLWPDEQAKAFKSIIELALEGAILDEDNEDIEHESQTDRLLKLCQSATCFKTPEGNKYADVPVNGHREIKGIGEKGGFRLWLVNRYYNEYGSAASTTAVAQAIEIITAQTEENAPTCDLFIRVGNKDGKIYLDMCNEKYQVIEIDAEGWRMLDNSPVYFRRSPGMLPLPDPTRGGKIEDLKPFLNLASEDDWRMIVAFVLMMLHPNGPYPVLALGGEEGSTKSSTTRYIRSVIDPHVALSKPAPKDKTDLNVAAQSNWVVALENLSSIPQWLSDALCRLSTGNADSARKLYTDGDEYLFVAKRCVIVNGIADLVTRSDLLSRTLTVGLPTMAKGKYKSEKELNREFAEAHPFILGAILDIISVAICNLPHNNVSFVSRMAEMEAWMYAAAPALGWADDEFRQSYVDNRDSGMDVVLEASQVAQAILAMMENTETWRGSSTELDQALKAKMGDDLIVKQWPSNPKLLSDAIKKLVPALRARNIYVTPPKKNNGRRILEIVRDADRDAETQKRDAETQKRDADRDAGTQNRDAGTQEKEAASLSKTPTEAENSLNRDARDAEIPPFSVREKEKEKEERHNSKTMPSIEKDGKPASLASLGSTPPFGVLYPSRTKCYVCKSDHVRWIWDPDRIEWDCEECQRKAKKAVR